MKRLFFITVLFLLISLTGYSQIFQLSGKVTENQKALSHVHVYVTETQKSTYTNEDGFYNLELPKGSYQLIFTNGSQKVIEINLTKNQTLDVSLDDLKQNLEEVFVSAYRVDADSPITFSNLENEEIKERNLGQDIPILMNFMPSVVTTSDAGAGIGYTGIRVRGSEGGRINTTINGIPLNDGESQGVFWVNLGDFSNSVENLQLQRGVGTSTNGAGAFGASLNIITDDITEKSEFELTNTYGSFNTHKHQVKFNTGRINKHFAFSGNYGIANSDGYRDRAFSDLTSYFLQGVYQNKNTLVKAIGFGGKQQTYQAWDGITKEQLKEDRTFNPAGMYVDKDGNTQFYKNQTDNYAQDHLQILWNQKYDSNWSSNLTFHYTYGRGYYENYKQDGQLSKYGLPDFEYDGNLITSSDLINEKWLSNHFYGTVFNMTYKNAKVKADFGGGWSRYWGDHYGSVIYAEFAQLSAPFEHYYDNKADKRDYNFFGKITWNITDQWAAFGDIQYRGIHYKVHGPYEQEDLDFTDNFSFLNPKAGITYQFNTENQAYFSYARANKEPTRSDYKAAILGNDSDIEYPKAEQLNDYELGWRHKSDKFWMNANLYYMDYHNQLVLTGEMDSEGRLLRKNSGRSYRVGLELEANIQIMPQLQISPNLTVSQNKNKNFKAEIDDELVNFGNTNVSFSPNIIAGNALRYTPIKNLSLVLLTKFVGEQYMGNIDAKDSKLDSYLTNDFNIQYRWNTAPLFNEIIFTGLINNFLNEKYVSNGYYDPVYGAGYYPQAGINFLTGVTLKF